MINKGAMLSICDLNNKEKLRLRVLEAFINKQVDRETALNHLKISNRQFIRLVQEFKSKGINGIQHKLKGQPSNNKGNIQLKQIVVELYKAKYAGFNYVHASKKMATLDDIHIHHDTLRLHLLSAGITKPKHKRKQYHKQRQPRGKFGELLQFDGSIHDWFGDGRLLCLMHLVDDATKTSLAMLFEGETTYAALVLLHKWCELYGVPDAIYTDRDSVYKVNDRHHLTMEEEFSIKQIKMTDFGKVCDRLGIKQIFAYSAPAKGRVERKHALYQDRLVNEMKLFGLKTIKEVNEFLLQPGGFIEEINSEFTIEPREGSSTCLKLPTEELHDYFTIDTTRTVRNDYTISFKSKIFQLAKHSVVRPKSEVMVRVYLDGTIKVTAGKTILKYNIVDNYQKPIVETPKHNSLHILAGRKILKDSPWREFSPPKKYKSPARPSAAYLDYVSSKYG